MLRSISLALASLSVLASSPAWCIPGETAEAAPLGVERGDGVVLLYRSGMLEIRADGRALSKGAKGQQIRVFNQATRRTISGVVEGPGMVVIEAAPSARGSWQ